MLGVAILVFFLAKGCSNGASAVLENEMLRVRLDTLASDWNQREFSILESRKKYEDSMSFKDREIELKENQLQAARNEAATANKEISALLKRHRPIEPNVDTTITTVPNEYIVDCAECFNQLEAQQLRGMVIDGRMDSLKLAFRSKDVTQNNRITQLELEKKKDSSTISQCLAVAKRQSELLEPKGKLYFSLGAIWAPMPRAVGAGLAYADKRGRIFSAKVYGGEWGTIYGTDLIFPLSFKRR